MRGRIVGEAPQPKAHRFPTPHSSHSLLPASDKCLSSFWFTVQLCRVRAGWGPRRQVDTQWSMHPSQLFYSRVVVRGGQASRALSCEISFHGLCFYWFLLVFGQNQSQCCQKAKSLLQSCLENRQIQGFFSFKCGRVGWLSVFVWMRMHAWRCHASPSLLEAWVSASFGVRKRNGSLSGLVPDMEMDWTCTM